MLNKGLRDNESIRIDNVLKTLRSLDFLPEPFSDEEKLNVENQLKEFGLDIPTLSDYQDEALIEILLRNQFDWNQLELFADFLLDFSKVKNYNFKDKALAIYQYIQKESKVFSFEINAKISTLKNQ